MVKPLRSSSHVLPRLKLSLVCLSSHVYRACDANFFIGMRFIKVVVQWLQLFDSARRKCFSYHLVGFLPWSAARNSCVERGFRKHAVAHEFFDMPPHGTDGEFASARNISERLPCFVVCAGNLFGWHCWFARFARSTRLIASPFFVLSADTFDKLLCKRLELFFGNCAKGSFCFV